MNSKNPRRDQIINIWAIIYRIIQFLRESGCTLGGVELDSSTFFEHEEETDPGNFVEAVRLI